MTPNASGQVSGPTTRMYREAGESAAVVRTQLAANRDEMRRLGATLRRFAPRAVVTCGRGSSDHAATFAKYLIETHARVLTSSAAPSLNSIYQSQTDLEGVVFIAISQSGQSPDIVAAAQAARDSGALVVSLCNSAESPLALSAQHSLPLHAGGETSIAATKSYLASLAAIVDLVASWTEDRELAQALKESPDELEHAWALDWSAGIAQLVDASGLFVIGRGYGLGVAQEAALKFKETCGLHAEGFSAAEVQHGPMALVRAGFSALMFAQNDETSAGMQALARTFTARGANVLLAGVTAPGAIGLPTLVSHPVIEPLLMIQSFYKFANALALARGLDPDVPPHLNKITETV